jgi:membrane-associated phospholipid phosphatase
MLEGLVRRREGARVTTSPPLLRQPPPAPAAKPRTTWSLRPGRLGLAVACAVAVWVTQWVFVQSARGQRWDEQWRIDVQSEAGLVWDARAHDFGVVSLRLGLLLCLVLAVVALARRRVDLFVRGAVVVAGANATTQLLKRVVIERPDYDIGFGPNALPSGHTTLALSVVIAALIVLPAATRPLVAVVGGVWAVAMAASAVVSGWHRPSDIVASILVCAGWAALVAAVRTRPARI